MKFGNEATCLLLLVHSVQYEYHDTLYSTSCVMDTKTALFVHAVELVIIFSQFLQMQVLYSVCVGGDSESM